MSTKHTPGPWTYGTSENGWSYTINISQADGAAYTPDWSDVAWCTCQGERQSVQEANARLIAAAPELLEALERMVGAYERLKPPGYPLSDPEKQAMAAITKATAKANGGAA